MPSVVSEDLNGSSEDPYNKYQYTNFWYLLHMQTEKPQMSLHIHAVSPGPWLLTYIIQ